jgi:crossover junction endodeoxyribonuclease RuvC
MLVLGVDPGSVVTGYGLVEKKNQIFRCVDAGVVQASKKQPFAERIHAIYRSMVDIMSRHRPQEMAIEDVFFAKNPKSALKIGHARGAVLIAAVECGIGIHEYAATEIKQSVVGYGRASKEQVRSMVSVILKLDFQPKLDTSDALAAAVCHLNWQRYDVH